MSQIISVDIGGTQIRAATFHPGKNTPIQIQRNPTHSDTRTVYAGLISLIENVWPKEEKVRAISVAVPGPLEPKTGLVHSTPNIKEWVSFPLGEKLQSHFQVPVHLDNDANLAALGEWRYGAGKGHHDILFLTISTGIGGGVVLDDRLLHGWKGLATELGHITAIPDGPICSCGQAGHLEAIASGPGIVRYVVDHLKAGEKSILSGENFTPKEIANAARNGDRLSLAAFRRAGEVLGRTIADFLHMFNPSIVILGGGVSQSSDLFMKPMIEMMTGSVMDPNYVKDLVVAKAELGDEAGLVGALVQAEVLHPELEPN
jgi:glucokinase